MREVTKSIIKEFDLNRLKYDFMGFKFENMKELSYHHTIIPRRLNGETTFENGVALVQKTAHEYLHTIERINNDMYLAITSEMLDEKFKGYIDFQNLKYINDILEEFEKEYWDLTTKKGYPIIKEEYKRRILKR